MQFGFTVKPEHSLVRHVDLTRRAEAASAALANVTSTGCS